MPVSLTVTVTVPCIFDFRFVSPKIGISTTVSAFYGSIFICSLSLSLCQFRLGSKFDQGLFIAHLMFKIDPSMHFSPFIHLCIWFPHPSPHLSLFVGVYVTFLISWPIYLSFVMNHCIFGLLFWQFSKVGMVDWGKDEQKRAEKMRTCEI